MTLRDNYLEKIKNFIKKSVIKSITGMRRVVKSYFIKQIIDYLKKGGINRAQILYINKEFLEFDFIVGKSGEKMYTNNSD